MRSASNPADAFLPTSSKSRTSVHCRDLLRLFVHGVKDLQHPCACNMASTAISVEAYRSVSYRIVSVSGHVCVWVCVCGWGEVGGWEGIGVGVGGCGI